MADFDPSWAGAIASIESGGHSDPYSVVTPNPNGKRALGKYQVMDFNVPEWTKAALGSSLTPEQFLANPDAQETVFRHRFGGYVDKYGNPQDAASAWFTGGPLAYGADKQDSLGTTGNKYVAMFNNHLKTGSKMADGALSDSSTLGPGVLAPGVATPSTQPGGFENGLMGAAAALAGIASPAQAQALLAQQALNRKTPTDLKPQIIADPNKSGMALAVYPNGKVERIKAFDAKDPNADKWAAARIQSNSALSDDIDKNASASNNALAQITSLKSLLSGKDAPYQGPGGEAYNKAYGLASMIPGVDTGKLAKAQTAQAIMNEISLGLRNFAGGMPGSLSDKDLAFLRAMAPSLNNRPEANGQILDMLSKVHNRNLSVQKQRDEFLTQHGQINDDFRRQIAAYGERNRLFPDTPEVAPQSSPATGKRPPLSDIFK